MTVATATLSMFASMTPSSVLGTSLPAKAMRDLGQSEFVTLSESYGGILARSMTNEAPSLEGAAIGGDRIVEESDVFKIRPGSKELYLLNQYRGLQVVSFDKGAEFPELLGRSEATGNYSTEMYSDWANDRLVAIENYYNEETQKYAGHVVLYSIADKKKPSVSKDINLNGQIVDSRKVGDVLYVVTRVRIAQGQDYWWSRGGNDNQDYEAIVYSFNMDSEFTKVEEHKIAGKLAYSNNILNTVRDGDKYYLMAGLYGDQQQGNWWLSNSKIAVLDISDPAGKIESAMKVDLRGSVREKSQIFVKDGYFVAASNYESDFTNQMRVSVEAYKIPGQTTQTISQVEADFIKYQTEVAVAAEQARLIQAGTLPSNKVAEEVEAYRKALVTGTKSYKSAFGELNLKQEGMMTLGEDGFLSPIIASSQVDSGDTQGQDASIQDVRLHNDLLYVFWVPRNLVDPLDIFDVSDLKAGVAYKNRLQFDGWMERSFPFSYNNKNYIIGLGYKQPATGTAARFRFLQAGLFEVKQSQSGAVRATQVSSFDLESADVRSNLNSQDKYMEFKFDAATGKGAILLSAYQYRPNYQSGGKVIYFDVNEAEFNFDQVFSEGEMLAAKSSWLRRVFSNPEIDKIHAFSNKNLSTFEGGFESGSDRSQEVSKAVSVLELARNIRSFFSFEIGGSSLGVQVIQEGNYWYGNTDAPTIELRLVRAAAPDSEKAKVIDAYSVEGNLYSSYFDQASQNFYMVTQKRTRKNGIEWNHDAQLKLVQLKLDAQNGIVESEIELKNQSSNGGFNYGSTFFPTDSGNILFLHYGAAYSLSSAGVEEMAADASCFPNTIVGGFRSARNIKEFNGQFYITEQESKQSDKYRNVTEERHYMTPVKVDFAGKQVLCGTKVNVPGEVVLLDGDKLLTKDQLLVDMLEVAPEQDRNGNELKPTAKITNQGVLVASVFDTDKVSITDVERFDTDSIRTARAFSQNQVVFFETTQGQADFGWGGPVFARDFGPGIGMPWGGRQESKHYARFFSVNDSNEIEFTTRQFLAALDNVQLSELFEMNGKKMALVRGGREYQVFAFNSDNRPEGMKVKEKSVGGTLSTEATATFKLPSYYHQGFNGTPMLNTIEFAMGDYGVKQVKIDF